MHASYHDITSRIPTPPLWFDEHAVPRYCEFTPSRSASIHIGEIALAEITCQACRRKFRVAFSDVNIRGSIADAIRSKTLHFGDPPRHDDPDDPQSCEDGGSMNSEPLRVIEYWKRHDPKYTRQEEGIGEVVADMAWFEWVRDPSLEIGIERD